MGDKARWRKWHNGKLYQVTCRELNAPASKAESYQAANAWWGRKRAEIELQAEATHPHAGAIRQLERKVEWFRQHDPDKAEPLRRHLETVRADLEDPCMLFDAPDSPSEWAVWQERFKDTAPEITARTIGAHRDRFLELEKARHDSGDLSASQFALTRLCLNGFCQWIGPGNDPGIVTPDRWEGYWLHLTSELSKGQSVGYCRKRLNSARSFISWLGSKGILPIPSNLHNKRYKFGGDRKPVKVFTPKEARNLVDRATGQTKLHLLLMLNCGFTQVDISDLHPLELKGDRIVRRRSKTGNRRNVPTVSYRLWPCTLALLDEHKSENPNHVLLNRRGLPWVERSILDDGRVIRRDGIEAQFRKLDPSHSLKTFRATSSTLLDGSVHNRFKDHFLGHAPLTTADRYYVNRDSEGEGSFSTLFDEAVSWLAGQYGFPS